MPVHAAVHAAPAGAVTICLPTMTGVNSALIKVFHGVLWLRAKSVELPFCASTEVDNGEISTF